MNLAETAWAAGLFEGEGYIGGGNPNSNNNYVLTLGMTDEDVVDKFHSIVGVGRRWMDERVRRSNGRHQNCYFWGTTNFADTWRLLCTFAPYLGKRRTARMTAMLRLRWSKMRGLTRCKLRGHKVGVRKDGREYCVPCRKHENAVYHEANKKARVAANRERYKANKDRYNANRRIKRPVR